MNRPVDFALTQAELAWQQVGKALEGMGRCQHGRRDQQQEPTQLELDAGRLRGAAYWLLRQHRNPTVSLAKLRALRLGRRTW